MYGISEEQNKRLMAVYMNKKLDSSEASAVKNGLLSFWGDDDEVAYVVDHIKQMEIENRTMNEVYLELREIVHQKGNEFHFWNFLKVGTDDGNKIPVAICIIQSYSLHKGYIKPEMFQEKPKTIPLVIFPDYGPINQKDWSRYHLSKV